MCTACGSASGDDDEAGRLRAAVRTPRTEPVVRFETPAAARPCASGGRGVVLEGADGGNGVLVLLRAVDSLTAGEYGLLVPGDSVTPRGAIVATRYMTGDMAHGFRLDGGTVHVRSVTPLSVRVVGSGHELSGALTVQLEAEFTALPLGHDSVTCRVQP